MALNKFKNEKNLIRFFWIVSLVVFGLSAWFLFSSMRADEIGGCFISSMLLFISGYGLIVFVARSLRYRFLTKLQYAVLVDEVRYVSSLAEMFGKSPEKINRELQFMINSGYLEDFNIEDEEVIYSESEKREQKELETKKHAEQMSKRVEEKKAKQEPAKKQVIRSQKCPNCGAKIKFDNKNEVVCPYCGNNLTR